MQVHTVKCQVPVAEIGGAVQDDPGALVHVYTPGTTTHVSIFLKDGVTPQDNPVTADSNALAVIAAADGAYDIQIVSSDGTQTLTIPNVQFKDIGTDVAYTTLQLSGADPASDAYVGNFGFVGKRMGALIYKGTWNASANSPALISSTAPATGAVGWFYVVSAAGTTTLDSIASWNVGDIAWFDGTAWRKIEANLVSVYAGIANVRTKLFSDTTWYVRKDGSDSNTGLGDDSAHAFLTIGKAVSTVVALDLNSHTATIQVRAGTYAENVSIAEPIVGGSIVLTGDTVTPSNVVISPASGIALNIQLPFGNTAVAGFKLVSVDNICLNVVYANVTLAGVMEYGACGSGSAQINVVSARLTISSNYTISGGGGFHINAQQQSTVAYQSALTVTLSGTPVFGTAFAQLRSNSFFDLVGSGTTFSGSATGIRFIIGDTTDINTSSGTDPNDQLPGSIKGQYKTRFDGTRAFRNLLINGAGVLQEGPSGTLADDTYGLHNRWYAMTQSGAITPSTLTDVQDGLPYMIRLTNSFVSAQRLGYAQIIRGKNCKHLRGQYVTLSGKARPSVARGIRCAILEWTGTEDVVTSDVVSNWGSASISVGGFFNATNLILTASSATSFSANTIGSFTTGGQLSSSFNNIIVILWVPLTMDNAETLDFIAQLERSTVATRFESRPEEIERRLSRPYYQAKTVQSQNGSRHIPLEKMIAAPTVAVGVGSASHITQDGFELTHTTQADCTVTASAEL